MYRAILPLPRPVVLLPPPYRHSHQSCNQEPCKRILVPLALWLCVMLSVRYGYYGDCRMVLGPSSSRLLQASSLFVRQIEVRDVDKKGVLLYGSSEKPELSSETNWSVSDYIIVASYSRKGFSLWLNKGSRIRMRWEAQTSLLNELQIFMIKGEKRYETLLPIVTSASGALNLSAPVNGKEAECTIEEDDKYYLGLINTNPRSIIVTLSVNVTSKLYDFSKAAKMCSTTQGSCRLGLQFPNTHYVLVTTPDNGDLGEWYIELSFVARVITYIAMLGAVPNTNPSSFSGPNVMTKFLTASVLAGFIVIMIFLVLKYLGACESETTIATVETPPLREVSETEPIMPTKPIPYTYGTNEEDDGDGSSSSSEDLYDAKLCAICYDDQRNCFFVPCGHCATCYDCAKRIMEEENKMCPICRRVIHKVRRLFRS